MSKTADAVTASPAHTPYECPECFTELQRDRDWWQARPEGSRLVGLVVARDDMPSVFQQREALSKFGVPIEGFRHPAPETLESWVDRLVRLFGRLTHGDVLVVVDRHALGRDTDEETRTIRDLRARGVIVKVLGHDERHLHDADL